MNKYNSVPNIRFKGFKDEWKNLKLGELSEIARGASPRPINNKKWFSKDSKIGWLRISDVTEQNGRIFYLKQKLSIQGQKKTRVIKTKHLLLSIAATVGSPVINYIPTGVHDGFLIFYNPKFDIEFMFQWLQKYRKNWSKFGQPGSQVNLNSEIVRNQKVYIPEEKEERDIANLFLKIDRLLDLQQQKIDKLELLKKALLQNLFPMRDTRIPEFRFKGFEDDWEKTRIGKIVQYSNSTYSVKDLKQKKGKKSYSVYDATGRQYYSNSFDMDKKYIAIIKDGSNVGVVKLLPARTSVLSTMGYLGAHNSDIVFDYYVFKKLNFKKYKVGSGIPHIYFSDYKIQVELVPQLSEQQKIGNLLSKVDQLIELENKKLQNLQQVKKSLLQNMFVD
ncbi:restriction endonuclease subunit S [Lactobacillus apis]|uniref:restriction endonuclease subunit S n=1 Tax=Lactobacillus apis TaxID=303541 RepID=UPI000D6C2544|nr:restriction endonuclease subunit S [Lactobacillus apis]AWM73392.1 restriction endonuclease subunit S [Lactobacillus apis]